MNKDYIMDALDHIDPAMIEAADRRPAQRRRNGWSRLAAVAACLCAVLAGTAVAVELGGVHITGFFHDIRAFEPDGPEVGVSGYTVSRGIRYFSIDELSQQIIELDQDFTQAYARPFSSWEQMEDFVGVRVMENPVLAAAPAGGTIDVGLPNGKGRFVVRLDPGPGHAADGVTPMTGITEIVMHGEYYLRCHDPDLWPWQGISVSVSAALMVDSENNPLDEIEIYHLDDLAVTQETYVTSSGLSVLILKAELPEQEGGSVPSPAVDWYSAYFTLNGVFFRVSAVDYKDFNGGSIPAGLVEETLKEVLDGFVCEPEL